MNSDPHRSEIAHHAYKGTPVDIDKVEEWLESDEDATYEELLSLFVGRARLFDQQAYDATAAGLVRYLLATRSTGTPELSTFEVLEYILAIFRMLWPDRKRHKTLLREIKNGLAKFLLNWPEKPADLVILVILEHLFSSPEVAEYFSSWRNHEVLGPAYREALDMATKGPPLN